MNLTGIHHLTAVTANAVANLAFYTGSLGLRLVKKTVNQDDVSVYHLFYADAVGSPGTDITFFDWPLPRERRGTHSIVRTGFRVAPGSLAWWSDRLTQLKIPATPIHDRDGRPTLDFEDPEGQRLALVADESDLPSHPWADSPIPPEHQIRGLGPITISIPDLAPTDRLLTEVLAMRPLRDYSAASTDGTPASTTVHVYSMDASGPAAELHVAIEPDLPRARSGSGGVHHVAFRIPSFDEYDRWTERLTEQGIRHSGPIDRFYFRSLYFREPSGILFELATDGPGFTADESAETLGQHLALPPFLEPRRKEIEAGLKPL